MFDIAKPVANNPNLKKFTTTFFKAQKVLKIENKKKITEFFLRNE
jgi:hypothetical protein